MHTNKEFSTRVLHAVQQACAPESCTFPSEDCHVYSYTWGGGGRPPPPPTWYGPPPPCGPVGRGSWSCGCSRGGRGPTPTHPQPPGTIPWGGGVHGLRPPLIHTCPTGLRQAETKIKMVWAVFGFYGPGAVPLDPGRQTNFFTIGFASIHSSIESPTVEK